MSDSHDSGADAGVLYLGPGLVVILGGHEGHGEIAASLIDVSNQEIGIVHGDIGAIPLVVEDGAMAQNRLDRRSDLADQRVMPPANENAT